MTKDAENDPLDTGGNVMACGSLYDIAAKPLALAHKVSYLDAARSDLLRRECR
jgi:hypothetical protein